MVPKEINGLLIQLSPSTLKKANLIGTHEKTFLKFLSKVEHRNSNHTPIANLITTL